MSKKLLPLFILFTALGLTSIAAYFSIIGISSLFSGAAIAVGILALFLEFGKIGAVTFVYRYWKKCKLFLKIYLVLSVMVLMIITSSGIAGMLMSSYQKSSIEFVVTSEKIKNTEEQKSFYQDKIVQSKKRIQDLTSIRISQESRMNGVLTNEFVSRNPLQLKQLQEQTVDLIKSTDNSIKEENQKIQESNDQIQNVSGVINNLKIDASKKKDVQTFKFVADALGVTLDTVAGWFITAIIFVFDPLAVCLILAYNVAVFKENEEVIIVSDTITPPTIETKPEVLVTPTDVKNEESDSKTNEWFTRYFKR